LEIPFQYLIEILLEIDMTLIQDLTTITIGTGTTGDTTIIGDGISGGYIPTMDGVIIFIIITLGIIFLMLGTIKNQNPS
tara:strand:+ start:102 stop:338 length:237 start_codon:yes stop_codon:yes gene_type:complete